MVRTSINWRWFMLQILFILLQNKQGKTRLSRWYAPFQEGERQKIETEVNRLIVNRDSQMTNFLEVSLSPTSHSCAVQKPQDCIPKVRWALLHSLCRWVRKWTFNARVHSLVRWGAGPVLRISVWTRPRVQFLQGLLSARWACDWGWDHWDVQRDDKSRTSAGRLLR